MLNGMKSLAVQMLTTGWVNIGEPSATTTPSPGRVKPAEAPLATPFQTLVVVETTRQ
jgi:hypothetical protein